MKKILFALLFSAFVSGIVFCEVPETFEKGIDLVNNWKFDEAISVFEKFIKENPDSKFKPMAMDWAGYCCDQKRDFLKSIDYCKKIISEYPKSIYAYWAKMSIARIYITRLDEPNKAFFYLDDLIKNNPLSLHAEEAYRWKGLLYQRNEEWKKSAEIYEIALKKFPNAVSNDSVRYLLAGNYVRLKNYKKAIEQYKILSETKNTKYSEKAGYLCRILLLC